ncbi:MAG: PHP domain-containing protein [Nitrososphaera sp.]|uniref:PHP domain-containing protein n=1 Tax=Nitrososphaera sp. TaxID=1971748 RepID=UPI003D6E7199
MNILEDYHVHCSYNDHSAPDLTVKNVLRRAEEIGLQTIAFTEHVRKTSEWIPDYLGEIEQASTRVRVVTGFEAKILRDGSIDCPKEYAEKYFLVASFHTKYGDKKVWMDALKTATANPDVDVLGHLAAEDGFDIGMDEVRELARLIVANDKIVELNAKYQRPSKPWLQVFKDSGVRFNLGSDAHSLQEVGDFTKISNLISIVEEK